MSYPELINSLHFQYKTAFDAVKSCTDKTDDEIAQIILELKSTKDKPKKSAPEVPAKEPKAPAKAPKEPKAPKAPTKETVKEPTKEPTKKTTKKPKVTKPTDDVELQLEP